MALDKLVDSTMLDAGLTSIANAIRTKGGTIARLSFPQGFVDAINVLNPPKNVMSITAVFTQGDNVVYDTDSLDTLKQFLVVTAHYDDNTNADINDYILSGTLTEGTSTITVSYEEKTTTFNVTVTAVEWYPVKTLDSSDIMYGYGNTTYNPYYQSRSSRAGYYNFDIFVEYGYIYKFEYTTTLPASNIGLQFYNESVYNTVQNQGQFQSNGIYDPGWQVSGTEIEVPEKISNSNIKGVRLTFRADSNTGTTAFVGGEITGVTISRKAAN